MGSTITSAGAASGIDFESIITASVKAKKRSMPQGILLKRKMLRLNLLGLVS